MSRREAEHLDRKLPLQLNHDTKDLDVNINALSLSRRLLNAGIAG